MADQYLRAELSLRRMPPRTFITVHLEDLVRDDREGAYGRLLTTLGIEDEPAMRAFFDAEITAQRAQIGRWREGRSPRECESLMVMYGQLLARMREAGAVNLPRDATEVMTDAGRPARSDRSRAGCGPGDGSSGGGDSGRHRCELGSSGGCVTSFRQAGRAPAPLSAESTISGSTRSVVLLAYHYPPMVGPASERAASFARHLPEAGWRPIVVTVKHGLFHRDLRQTPPPVHTLRTRSPEPGRVLRG